MFFSNVFFPPAAIGCIDNLLITDSSVFLSLLSMDSLAIDYDSDSDPDDLLSTNLSKYPFSLSVLISATFISLVVIYLINSALILLIII